MRDLFSIHASRSHRSIDWLIDWLIDRARAIEKIARRRYLPPPPATTLLAAGWPWRADAIWWVSSMLWLAQEIHMHSSVGPHRRRHALAPPTARWLYDLAHAAFIAFPEDARQSRACQSQERRCEPRRKATKGKDGPMGARRACLCVYCKLSPTTCLQIACSC